MRNIRRLASVGLIIALGSATFVACKKEKEQNGPSIIIPNEQGVIAGDQTLEPGTHTLKFKFVFQKGSGKDDADLKDFSFSANVGGANIPAFTNRPALNGTSFTWDTSFSVNGVGGQVYTYTVSIRDKNDKTASRQIKITFRADTATPPPPTALVDSLLNASVTNGSDGKGNYIRYANNSISKQTRTEAEGNPAEIVFVYFYSRDTRKHSIISPGILRDAIYDGTPVEWDNNSTKRTDFRTPPQGVSFESATATQIVNAYQNGQDVNEFPNNGTQRAECTPDRLIAFKQGNIYGLVKVENATENNPGAILSIKIARP